MDEDLPPLPADRKIHEDPLDRVAALEKPMTFRSWMRAQIMQETEYAFLMRWVLGGADNFIDTTKVLTPKMIVDGVREAAASMHPVITPETIDIAERMNRDWRAAKKSSVKILREIAEESYEAEGELKAALDTAQAKYGEEYGGMIRAQWIEEPGDREDPATHGVGVSAEGSGTDVLPSKKWVPQWYTPDGTPLRCDWRKPNGARCGRASIAPTNRCEMHGGLLVDKEAIETMLESAAKKVVTAADAAVDTLIELMSTSPNDVVRLKAAESILDRAGLPAGQKIEVKTTVEHTFDSPTQLVLERLDQLAAHVGGTPTPSEIEAAPVDAEIVDETA